MKIIPLTCYRCGRLLEMLVDRYPICRACGLEGPQLRATTRAEDLRQARRHNERRRPKAA